MAWILYRHLGTITNKSYIGQTKDWPKAKIINQIDIQTNKIIHTYVSANIASKETSISRGNINTCCRWQLKSAGGYKWEFAENKKYKLSVLIKEK